MIKVWDYLKEYNQIREEVLKEIDGVLKGGTLVQLYRCFVYCFKSFRCGRG